MKVDPKISSALRAEKYCVENNMTIREKKSSLTCQKGRSGCSRRRVRTRNKQFRVISFEILDRVSRSNKPERKEVLCSVQYGV